jgi:hypothetical protein
MLPIWTTTGITEVSFAQYGSSNLYGYQFVNQEILYALSVLYTFAL